MSKTFLRHLHNEIMSESRGEFLSMQLTPLMSADTLYILELETEADSRRKFPEFEHDQAGDKEIVALFGCKIEIDSRDLPFGIVYLVRPDGTEKMIRLKREEQR